MIRKIIHIDQEKCNGCGACAAACHEGAIEMINGKANLTREDYCDGLGDCLPACPVDAIHFEEREALAYDEAAVLRAKAAKNQAPGAGCACPGTQARMLHREPSAAVQKSVADVGSQLMQWPCQIKLLTPASARICSSTFSTRLISFASGWVWGSAVYKPSISDSSTKS